MGRHNIYIREEDEKVWDEVTELSASDESISRIVVGALKAYVSSRRGKPYELLKVEVRDELGQVATKKFSGRWLILAFKSDHDAFVFDAVRDGTHHADETEWWVAETTKGQFAVLAEDDGGDSGFYVFKDLDDAATSGIPADVLSAAAQKLGVDRAEYLDI